MYYLLNSLDYVYAERVVAQSMAGPEPLPRSLETGRPLHRFDVIIAPVSYELDYVTLARILHAAGIPLLREERENKDYPLLVLGGPVPSTNPAVAIGIGDLVAIGEAEPLLPLLAEKAYEHGAEKAVEELGCRPGFLAPGCEAAVRKAITRNLDTAFHSTTQFRVPGSGEPWGEAYMVEASRGCPHMCRFCMEAHFLLPTRHRSYARLRQLIEKGVETNNVARVAFYALSFFDHPSADKLLELLDSEGLEASIGSMRGDTLTEDRVELLHRLGQRVVTIAPETLSPVLCKALGKCIPMDTVEQVAEWAWRRRMHIKLYLMLGAPGETDKDVEDEAEKLRKLSRRAPPMREAIRVTVNPLIPKPMTPLQYHELIDRKLYEKRIKILRRAMSKVLSIDALSYRYAYAQTVIARGDEQTPRLIREWAAAGGRLGQLWTTARRLGINLEKYTKKNPPTPWHRYVYPGFPEKTLRQGYRAVLAITDQA